MNRLATILTERREAGIDPRLEPTPNSFALIESLPREAQIAATVALCKLALRPGQRVPWFALPWVGEQRAWPVRPEYDWPKPDKWFSIPIKPGYETYASPAQVIFSVACGGLYEHDYASFEEADTHICKVINEALA